MTKQQRRESKPAMHGDTIADTIKSALKEMTRTERRIAQTLLSQYPLLGLETLVRVADAAHTTAPTVLRFVNKLGYKGYADFQQALRSELQPQLQSALARHVIQPADIGTNHYLRRFCAATIDNIDRASKLLPEQEFDAIVALLSDINRPILCIGGRYSYALAHGFCNLLRDIRPRVDVIWNQTETWPSSLIDIGKRHVIVAFDFRRYQDDVMRFTRKAQSRGASVVLFTDEWMSGISRFANHVILSPVAVPSLYNSTVACVVQTEAIVGAVAIALKGNAKQRLETLENLREGDEPL